MKKTIVLTCLVFSGFCGFSQAFDKAFVKEVGNEICECLSKQTYSDDGMEEYFNTFLNSCAVKILTTKYVDKLDEFQTETKKNGTNNSVNDMFFAFFNDAQSVIMDDCDLVFEFYEAQKLLNAKAVKNLYEAQALKDLPRITKAIEEENQTQFMTMRGLLYFSIDSLEQAEVNLKPQAENADYSDFMLIQLYAYTLELNGKFDEAIELYEKAIVKKRIPFEFYLAATKRKKRESELKKD
jgi:tetratricopeptide (TPR) repeat protein